MLKGIVLSFKNISLFLTPAIPLFYIKKYIHIYSAVILLAGLFIKHM